MALHYKTLALKVAPHKRVAQHYYAPYRSPYHRVKCHKIIMIYPQPVRRHYHPKYTLITLAPVSYLRSLVVRAVHRHRTGVGLIPAGGPYS